MTLYEFKKKVRDYLAKQVGEAQAETLMNTYNDDFPEFLAKNYTPETTAMAMLMGY